MATVSDIAHRWANQDFGRDGSLSSGSCHCTETSFYSYSTVIAQWLDKKRNIMAVIDKTLTKSTGKHISWVNRAIRNDTIVFYFHQSASYGYDNVNVCNYRGEFDPMVVTKIFIGNILHHYQQFESSNAQITPATHWWKELQRFSELFPAGSYKKYLRLKMPKRDVEEERLKRKMLRALIEGRPSEEIVDIVCGKGAWEKYSARTKGLRTMKANREKAEKIAKHLGFNWFSKSPYTVRQLLSMSPLERVNIKLARLIDPMPKDIHDRRKDSNMNMYKFLGLDISQMRSTGWLDLWRACDKIYDQKSGALVYKRESWSIPEMRLTEDDIATFKRNPREFQKRFLEKARILGKIHKGWALHTDQVNGNGLPFTDEERSLVDYYLAFKFKRDRRKASQARMIQRYREEQERIRRAKEEAKAAKIAEYKARGAEGFRDLWRDHLSGCPELNGMSTAEFYYGGNVLLRLNSSKDLVETSKNIKLSITQATKLWKLVKIWHEHPDKFRRIEIPTKVSTFTAHSYENDILVAGCHSIAYCEMERMAKVLGIA